MRIRALLLRLAIVWRRRNLERDLLAELESHLDMHIADNLRAGMMPDEARRRALIALGGLQQAKERYRDQYRLRLLDELAHDVRFGLRTMRTQPAFTIAVVLTLALGIAANNFVFSIVNAVLLRDLPLHRPDRLLSIRTVDIRNEERAGSYPDFVDLQGSARAFSTLAAYRGELSFNIADDEHAPERVMGSYVSANAFGTIQKAPTLGRDFLPEDDRDGAAPVTILGHRLWMNRYAGDPSILGRTIRINGLPWTVIGVMPSGMEFPQFSQVWLPLGPASAADARNARRIQIFGRLADAATREEARAELEVLALRLAADHPDTNRGIRPVVRTLRPGIGWQWFVIFGAMTGAVGFVLLIACANIANLLLARSSHRSREMSVRLSLGASRWRLVRQVLVESLLLSGLAGLVAIALAAASLRLFEHLVSDTGSRPYWMQFALDARTFIFFAAVSIGTGILAGIVPALRGSQAQITQALRESDRAATSGGSRRLTVTLVTAELALTLILLTGAGAMMRRTIEASRIDEAVDTPELLTLRLQLTARDYPTRQSRADFIEQLDQKLTEMSGIGVFSITDGLPVSPGGERMVLHLEGTPTTGGTQPTITSIGTSSRYFDTLRLPLVRGRDFNDRDGTAGNASVIINKRLADMYFPGQDPLGKTLRLSETSPDAQPAVMTIVGVSQVIRQGFDSSIEPVLYVPYRTQPSSSISLIVRSLLPVSVLTSRIREEVRSIDPELPLFDVLRMDQVVTQMVWLGRIIGGLFAIFSFMALVLSAVGLYGVTAYLVGQRTREIGIRMALGADRAQVWWLVLRRAVAQLAIGLVLGIGGVLLIAPTLKGLLVGTYATDPATVGIISLMFVCISLAASFLPARRATRLSPATALRYE